MRIRIGRFLFLPLVACVLSVSAALERLDGAAPSKRNETDDILAAVRTAAEELRDGKAGAARERLFPLLDGIPLRWCFQNPVPSVLLFHRLATVEAVLGNVENAIQLSRVASILHTWMASHGPPAKVLDPIADSVLAGSQQEMLRDHAEMTLIWRNTLSDDYQHSTLSPPPPPAPPKPMIVTLCDYPAPKTSLTGITATNRRSYADRHGFPLRFFTRADAFVQFRHPAWAKIAAMQASLEDGRWSWWMDCDSLVTDLGTSLEEMTRGDAAAGVTPASSLPSSPPAILISDDGLMANTGVFALRGSDWARRFLQHVFGGPEDSERVNRILADLTTRKHFVPPWDLHPCTFHPHWEQAAMQLSLFQSTAEGLAHPSASSPASSSARLPRFWDPWLGFGCDGAAGVVPFSPRAVGQGMVRDIVWAQEEQGGREGWWEEVRRRMERGREDGRSRACRVAREVQRLRARPGETLWSSEDLREVARRWRFIAQKRINSYTPEFAAFFQSRDKKPVHAPHEWNETRVDFILSFSGCPVLRGWDACNAAIERVFDNVHAQEWAG